MMDEGQVFGRGIAFPPRIGPDGRVAWSVGATNIRESIRIILLTEFQERLMLPDFGGGLQGFLFEPNTVATRRLLQERATRALDRWEPRIEVTDLSVDADPDDARTAIVSIAYRLIATGAVGQVSLTLQFAA